LIYCLLFCFFNQANNVDVRLVMNGLTEVEMNSIRIISHSSVLATRSLGYGHCF